MLKSIHLATRQGIINYPHLQQEPKTLIIKYSSTYYNRKPNTNITKYSEEDLRSRSIGTMYDVQCTNHDSPILLVLHF